MFTFSLTDWSVAGMGRTPRASSSPYARANRNRNKKSTGAGSQSGSRTGTQHTQQPPQQPNSSNAANSRRQQQNPGHQHNNVAAGQHINSGQQINVAAGQQHDNVNSGQQQGDLTHQMEQIANTVTQRIVPEITDQVIQAIGALQRTPATLSTPDTVPAVQDNISGSQRNNNINLDSQINVTSAQSFDDELGLGVTQQLREKITNGEYVDLENLLVSSHTEQSRTIVIDNAGNLNLKQKSGKKITDINTWVDAMLIYTSIYIKAHPNSANALLKYIYNIKLGAARCTGLGWLTYDQQFRMKRARNQLISWGNVDMELWLLYITQGMAPVSNTQNSIGKCFYYNNKGKCGSPTCRYLHRCMKCGGFHSALYCIAKSTQNFQNQSDKGKSDETFRNDFRGERNFRANKFSWKPSFQGKGSNTNFGARKYTN